jgi:hypothetical protein
VGDYVKVTPNNSVGKCSGGGEGFVTKVSGTGGRTLITVRYGESSLGERGHFEHSIPVSKATVATMPSFVPRPKRNLATPTNDATSGDICLPPQLLIDILCGAHQCKRGKGWRRKDLGFEKSRTKDDRFVSQLPRHVKCLGWTSRTSMHTTSKSHIDKVMAVAIVGYAFDINVENGGHGLKIGLFRCQGARIAKKLQ